jgi:hypothetical protein
MSGFDQLGAWTPGAIGIWALLATVVVAVVKARPALRKIQNEGDGAMRADLLLRIQTLESSAAQRDAQHEAERIMHEAMQGIARHQINNLKQCLTALLMLLKRVDDPRVQEAVQLIEDMRARQEELEAQEKASVVQARLAAVAGGASL